MKKALSVVFILSLFFGSASLVASPAADLPSQEKAPVIEAEAAATESPLLKTVFDAEKRNVSCWQDCHDDFIECRDDCHGNSTCISECFEDQQDCRDLC